jgi:hypothetical protein
MGSCVTVKMMEAWLLTDAVAIMKAAVIPALKLPGASKTTTLEFEQAPKELLHHLLKQPQDQEEGVYSLSILIKLFIWWLNTLQTLLS